MRCWAWRPFTFSPFSVTFAASAPFSPTRISNHIFSLPSALGRCFLGVLPLYGSLEDKYISLGVIPVDETRSISDTEPFYYSLHFGRDDLLVPAVGHHSLHPAHRATLGGGSAEEG